MTTPGDDSLAPRTGDRPMSTAPLTHRLATYGTLAPGERNHHHLADLEGTWTTGFVLGHLSQDGWGVTHGRGYPALTPDPDGGRVPVHVLESAELPVHWARLDEFEGEGYARAATTVRTPDGEVEAYLYTHRSVQG